MPEVKKLYEVEVEVAYAATVLVEAEGRDEAEEKVDRLWRDSEAFYAEFMEDAACVAWDASAAECDKPGDMVTDARRYDAE